MFGRVLFTQYMTLNTLSCMLMMINYIAGFFRWNTSPKYPCILNHFDSLLKIFSIPKFFLYKMMVCFSKTFAWPRYPSSPFMFENVVTKWPCRKNIMSFTRNHSHNVNPCKDASTILGWQFIQCCLRNKQFTFYITSTHITFSTSLWNWAWFLIFFKRSVVLVILFLGPTSVLKFCLSQFLVYLSGMHQITKDNVVLFVLVVMSLPANTWCLMKIHSHFHKQTFQNHSQNLIHVIPVPLACPT